MTKVDGKFVCPNCGAVDQAEYYMEGYHYFVGGEVWDDIVEHLDCVKCGADVNMPEPVLEDTEELPF